MFDYEENKNKPVPWERILRLIYYLPQNVSFGLKNEKEMYKFFMKNSLHSELQVMMAVDFLKQQELLKIKKIKEGLIFILTPKGFEVALTNEKHERELEIQNKQANINSKLTFATIVVALATALSALITLYNLFVNTQTSNFFVFLLVLGILFVGTQLFIYLVELLSQKKIF